MGNDEVRIKIKIDSKSQELVLMKQQVQELGKSFSNTDSIANTFIKRLNLTASIYGGYQAFNNTLLSIARTGFETNKTMENLTNSLTTLRAVSASNVDSMGNHLTIQQKYNMAQQEANQTLQELIKINAQTPHSLDETTKIYDAMYLGMKKVGASSEDMIEITKKISIAAGNRMNFDALLSAMDGLSTGTVETASDMGRFLKSIGLSNEAIKNSSNVIQLFKDKLSGFQAIDSFDTRISNLNNSFATLAGTLTKPFFYSFSKSMIPASALLDSLNTKLLDYQNNINKVQDIHKQNNVITLKDELGELEKKLDSTKEASKRFYNEWTTNDEAEINKLELLIKTTKNKIKDLENPNKPKLEDEVIKRSDSDIIKIMGTEYQKLNLDIEENIRKLKDAGATELEINKYRADSIKNFNEKQSKSTQKVFKEQEKSAEELKKAYLDISQIGMSEYDKGLVSITEKTEQWKKAGVAENDILIAKGKLLTELTSQRLYESQKEDLSYHERKIQLMDDSISKELELQRISYANAVLEIENSTKSIAEKDKLIGKETELFNLTVQNANYKYNTDFQDTMSSFYDDMLESQLALNNAVFDFGSGFDGVGSKIGAISKSIAAMGSLELTNKKEASKLDKKYIEQFNKYAGDVGKTKELEQQYIKDTALLNEQNIQSQLNGYANITGAMASMFNEGSKEAASFQLIEGGLALASGIRAILTQGSGDPYTAFARMAAMAATVSSMLGNIGIAFGMNTTKSYSDAFSSMEANTGTGSVLGDTKAQSESINKSLDILENFAEPQYQTLLSMNNYLESIANSIGGVSSLLIQQGGFAFGEGYSGFDTGWKNRLDVNSGVMGAINPLTITDKVLDSIGLDFLSGIGTGVVNSILGGVFGKTKTYQSMTDAGIYFANQLLLNAIEQFDGSAYQTIQTTVSSKSWFSKSETTYLNSYFEALDNETERQFSLVFNNLYNTVLSAGTALDSAESETKQKLKDFVVSIGKVSLLGKSGDEIQETLTSIFGKVGDDITKAAFPLLTPFQQIGEGMFETLTRVSTGMEVAEYYIGRLGNRFNDVIYTAIGNKQGDIGFEALLQSIEKVEKATYPANNGLLEIVSNLDATAEELYAAYSSLDELRDRLIFLNQQAQGLSSSMIYGAGSVSELDSGFKAYFENFLNDSEQLAYKTQQLTEKFNDLGIALPASKDSFKTLLSGLDTTSKAGQELYGRLIVLSEGFAEVADGTKESIETLKSSLQDLTTSQFNTFITSLEDVGNSIKSIKQTALSFLQNTSVSNSNSLEQQIISYNKLRNEFSKNFDLNGFLKPGTNESEVSSLYSQISSLASNIGGQDEYLRNALISQFENDMYKFNASEDVIKVHIIDGLGSLLNLNQEQVNQLKTVATDGKITTTELNSIKGLTQTQKDGIIDFANNSEYFSTESTLYSLNEYMKKQLEVLQKTQAEETVGLSSKSFTYGDYIGKQEQIDIATRLGMSYESAKTLVQQLQALSISKNPIEDIKKIVGFNGEDFTNWNVWNQLVAFDPEHSMNIQGYGTQIYNEGQANKNARLERERIAAFEQAKAEFYTRYNPAVQNYNRQVQEEAQAYQQELAWGWGRGSRHIQDQIYGADALYAWQREQNETAQALAILNALNQEKSLRGYMNGTSNMLDDQLAMFNQNEIVVPTSFSDGIRQGDLSLGNNNELVEGIVKLTEITKQQAQEIQKIKEAFEEFNTRELIKTAKGVA